MGFLDELTEQERDPLPYLGAAGTAAALGYGAYRTAPYYKAKADDLGTWVQALDNTAPDSHILNEVHSHVDPDVASRVVSMVYDPVRNGVESGDGSRWSAYIHSRKPSFTADITNSGHLDSSGRKAPFTAAGSLPTKDLDSWGEALKAKMHEDATVYGRTLDPDDVNSVVDSLVDRHRRNIFRRAASLAEDASDLPGRIAKTLFKTSQDKSMNHYLKLAYNHGAQQALRDLGLEKTAAVPGPGFLHRLGLPGLGHMHFLPKGAFANFSDDFAQGGLTGMGYGGDLALAAAASMGAFKAADD